MNIKQKIILCILGAYLTGCMSGPGCPPMVKSSKDPYDISVKNRRSGIPEAYKSDQYKSRK